MQEREILFRGKRVDTGEWVTGASILDCTIENEKSIYIISSNSIGKCSTNKYGTINNLKAIMRKIILETRGEYTGLTDKNGVKIFEGDILKCNDNPMDLVKAVFGEFVVIDIETERRIDTVIGWHYEVIPTDELSKIEPFCFAMPLTAHYVEVCSMEVIGNIHDNPELIKE